MTLTFGLYVFHCIFCRFIHAEFKCFTNESNIITYANNPTKEVKLPTIRLIQGYYPSQHAMQYAAYVYLTEKIGLNVTMYPMTDPNGLHIFAANGSMVPAYPEFYFSWIAQNRYDLLFEIWDDQEQEANAESYYLNQTVKFAGISGVWSESGWFVPTYLYEAHPDWISPGYMISDPIIRQHYIDAAAHNASINWIEYAYNQSLNGNYTFDTPSYSKPTIFACCDHYILSDHTHQIILGILNRSWNLVTLGGEDMLTQFILDLYSKQLPFIIAHYSPHPDFFKFEFERVSLPRNPSNTVFDSCFISGECTFPLTALRKIGNPLLAETFPEILDFLDQYNMNANDVNFISGIQDEIWRSNDSCYSNDTSLLNSHEIWQYAVCEWMRKVDLSSWTISIVRYDCYDGTSMALCIMWRDKVTSIILLTLGGVVGLITMIFMIYKTTIFCGEFQKQFGAKSADSAQVAIIKKEKRKLFISMFTDGVSLLLSFADLLTDLISTTSIVLTKEGYSSVFVIAYFALFVIVLFVAAIHIFITCKNIVFCLAELKRGRLLLAELSRIHAPALRENELETEIDKLLAKKQLLLRHIKHQSVTIFVGFCQDLPFLIMNLYCILRVSNYIIITSLVCNCLSLGYKACILKEFCGNVDERNDLKESITNLYHSNHQRSKRKRKKDRRGSIRKFKTFKTRIMSFRQTIRSSLTFNTSNVDQQVEEE